MAESTRHIPSGTDAPAVSASHGRLAETDALAFATDPASEQALHEGLAHLGNAQVWDGGLRAATEALGAGHAARLVFVDLDGVSYPAGAIHELSAVCEVGTAVVAFGEDPKAGRCREALLAGVSEYLVKPLHPEAVRAAAERAAGGASSDARMGALVGFAGPGGTGTTTLAAATALAAASRGRYVSVLDLHRTCPALALALDVEPPSGLVDLLSANARASLNPEMLERVGAVRSDRVAVYAYPWSAGPPPPLAPVWAVCELLVELQRRSHLVIVDGMDDAGLRQALLAIVDTRVLVVEPTATGAAAAARMAARLGPLLGRGWPSVLVQNHTRAFDAQAGARALVRAGLRARPGVVVPFEPALPAFAAWGMPDGGLPRALRAPLSGLADRLLAPAGRSGEGAGAEIAARSAAAAKGRARRGFGPAAARRAPLRAALRRLLPSGGGRSEAPREAAEAAAPAMPSASPAREHGTRRPAARPPRSSLVAALRGLFSPRGGRAEAQREAAEAVASAMPSASPSREHGARRSRRPAVRPRRSSLVGALRGFFSPRGGRAEAPREA